MSDPMKTFERWVQKSKEETPPSVDVRDAVLREIRLKNRDSVAPLVVFAAGSTVTAVLTAALSFSLLHAMTSPVGSVLAVLPSMVP